MGKAWSGLFDFNDDLLLFEEEIKTRPPSSVAWAWLLITNIAERYEQQRVQEILNIVFVGNGKRRPFVMTIA
ncbi:hypothetical protein D7X99_09835 [Corallococcus sp. AB032C]|nr:hypothetical protein D7X99_09835 [Corallococcus sp. AB032C]